MLNRIWKIGQKLLEFLRLYDVRILNNVDDAVGKIFFVMEVFF